MRRTTKLAISNGFTLIELMVVVILLGLMATIASIAVSGQLDQSRLHAAVDRIIQADQAERAAVRTSPLPGELILETVKHRLRFQCSAKTIDLGRSIQIAEVLMANYGDSPNQLVYSQNGQSPTYALRLQTNGGAFKWLFIVGSTGQVLIRSNTEDIRRLFALGAS